MWTTALAFLLLYPQLVDSTHKVSPPQAASPQLSHEKRADIFMARKMYREATDEYQIAIAQRPTPRLYNKLGISYHQRLLLEDARRSYEQAARLDRSYAQAVNNLGTVYYARRKFKKAQKMYQKALKLDPDSASIYSNLGTAYFARHKYKQASRAYLRALELDPKVFERRTETGTLLQERSVRDRAKYYYFLAQAYASAGLYDNSLLYLRRALEEGFKNRRKILNDKAFEPMLEMPEFQALVNPEAKAAQQSG